MNKKLECRFTLCMPDGFLLSVSVYEGESAKEKIKSFTEHWYEVANKDPKTYDHFDIKDKCPKCGGPMRCKLDNDYAMIWCMDHNCGYQNIEDGLKARDRVFEKHGISVKWVKKTGASVVYSNVPIKKKM